MFREQSLLPYSNLPENNSFFGVHVVGFFTYLKEETEISSEAFCFTYYSTKDKVRT
jgi:hypothetical protein